MEIVFLFAFRNDGNDNYSYLLLFKHQYDKPGGLGKLIEYCKSNKNYPANSASPDTFCTHIIYQNNFKIKGYPIKF